MARADHARAGLTVRCAIYTRKSSDEGLEQEFNSLDAQREACEAYIVSQRHAGWIALSDMYDDGGLSGGTMERPALKRLLEDIHAGKVQIVVVYKVDRLTRSLADFAKIVDVLDARNASFVSVTQQFNTTTSMGRLTLNMLLSFAQFEREIAGERIRDKIAASKRKGMWMGGNVPLGYDVKDRKLIVNETEASTVRLTFKRYAELGSVSLLRAELDRQDIVSKRREGAGGRLGGGQHFSRGALYLMLQNRLYRGDIVHQGTAYPGQHEGIIDAELWQIVQDKLAANRQQRSLAVGAEAPSLLAGLIVDGHGNPMTPTHATKKAKHYRYYVSASLLAGDYAQARKGMRVPAGDIEGLVLDRLKAFFSSRTDCDDGERGCLAGTEGLRRHHRPGRRSRRSSGNVPFRDCRDAGRRHGPRTPAGRRGARAGHCGRRDRRWARHCRRLRARRFGSANRNCLSILSRSERGSVVPASLEECAGRPDGNHERLHRPGRTGDGQSDCRRTRTDGRKRAPFPSGRRRSGAAACEVGGSRIGRFHASVVRPSRAPRSRAPSARTDRATG